MTRRVGRRDGLAVLVSTLTLVAAGGCAVKQPAHSFADLEQRVKPGHTVYVIDHTGSETKGKIAAVTASELTIEVDGARRSMNSASVRQVQRYGDSLWNGVLIGSAIGASAAVLSDPRYQPCKNEPQRQCQNPEVGYRILSVALFGAAGAGIDALIRGRRQVYLAPGELSQSARRLAISPQLGLSRAGVFVVFSLNKTNDD